MSAAARNGAADEGRSAKGSSASLLNADRDRQVSQNTRRVVMASLGVLKSQEERRNHSRALAIAAILVIPLILGPMVWFCADHFNAGGTWGDLTSDFTLWVCLLCSALLGAVFVAVWLRGR